MWLVILSRVLYLQNHLFVLQFPAETVAQRRGNNGESSWACP